MRRLFLIFACALVVFLVTPPDASAQTTTGTVDGVVLGPDGNALPRVAVVTNSPALIRRDLTVYTDATGYYRLPLLLPGTYEVVFELDGFRMSQEEGVVVRVGQTTELGARLELASVSETELVSANAPIIDARAAKLAFTYTGDVTNNLPVPRTVNDVFFTIPGVEVSANSGNLDQPGLVNVQTVLGAGERSNDYRLDGANVADPATQWNTQMLMPFDTIEEIQVVKSAKPAEIPFQGGLFNIITKSGGNELHGQVGAYFVDDALQGQNAEDIREEAGVESTNEIVSGHELTASLGGKIVADRLWWYGSARRFDDTSRIFGFPSDIDSKITSASGKLTYQANPNHRIVGTVTGWDQEVSHLFFGFAPSLAVDENAAAFRPMYGITYGAQWSGIFSENTFAEAGISYAGQGYDQLAQPGATEVPFIDLVTGQRSRNLGDGVRVVDNYNYSLTGSLSWYVPDAAGRHDIKLGGSYLPTHTVQEFDDVQDHRLHTLFGRNFAVRFVSTPSTSIWDIDTAALYAQDAWSIGDRLTLNLGVRFMHATATTPEAHVSGGTFAGTAIADRFPELNATTLAAEELTSWSAIEPRLAATFALDRAGRTVLRAGASQYHHNLAAFDFFVSNPAFPHNFVTLWFDRNGDSAFQVGEDGPLLFSFGGQINPVDPDLKPSYSNEFVLGMSHEATSDIQVSANFIYRKDKALLNTVDIGVPFSSYTPTGVIDPGPDGVPGTGDDATITVFAQDPATIGQSELLLTNPDASERTYKGVELTASKRFSNNWQAVASLVLSDTEVIKPTTVSSEQGVFDSPNNLINAKGRDPNSSPYQLKLQGMYRFRFGLMLSGYYSLAAGRPYTRELVVTGLPQGPFNVFAEQRGDSSTDTLSQLDLRLEQDFNLGSGRIGVMLDVFNLFNAAAVNDYGFITGVDYGSPRAIQRPRAARIGLRYDW